MYLDFCLMISLFDVDYVIPKAYIVNQRSSSFLFCDSNSIEVKFDFLSSSLLRPPI